MDKETFEQFRMLIRSNSGISLTEEKIPLLVNRINKRLRALNIREPREYLMLLKRDESGDELINLIDVISTNVTYFYREEEHFEVLKSVLKEMQEKRPSRIRIWCAASSSGEEPFTIAITAYEALELEKSKIDFQILATDICTKVLNKALDGLYSGQQLERVPADIMQKYFTRIKDRTDLYAISPMLKKYVTYKRLNLSVFPFPLKGSLDIVFCRNVMIYFERELRQQITSEFERLLRPGGYLFLSRSENLLGIKHSLKNVETSVYQKL